MIEVRSDHGSITLSLAADALNIEGLKSHGRPLEVRGTEFAVVPRGSRVPIVGWYARALDVVARPIEATVRRAREEGWQTVASPVLVTLPSRVVLVTEVELPPGSQRQKFELVVGAPEAYSWDSMLVAIDGATVGRREHPRGKWAEPLRVAVPPTSRGRGRRFVTIVAILEGPWTFSAKTADVDPDGYLPATLPVVWPAQFEQYVEASSPTQIHSHVVEARVYEGDVGEGAIVGLTVGGRSVRLQYEWAWGGRALIRRGHVAAGPDLLVRWVDHGTWTSSAPLDGGGAGEPIALKGFAVRGLLHPAGWSIRGDHSAGLRQYTSRGQLDSLQTACTLFAKEDTPSNELVREFLSEHSARRRQDSTVRAFFGVDGFGSWSYTPTPGRPYWELLDDQPMASSAMDDIARVSEWTDAGIRVDYYSLDFLTGFAGEVAQADPQRVPLGFAPLVESVAKIPAAAGIWLDTSSADWSVGQNHKFSSSRGSVSPFSTMRENLCLASEPYRTSFADGLERLAGEGFHAVKLDNLQAHCVNPSHEHLPGIHAYEAVTDSATALISDLHGRHPQLLVHLYWGYRSPWWALWATTQFDPGFNTEAAHPFVFPSASLRASAAHAVTVATVTREDLPPFSKDSLGVWLSNWRWNSSQGHSEWRVAFAFDLARANRFPQIWTGEQPLTAEDLAWLARVQRFYQADCGVFDRVGRWGVFSTAVPEPYALACASSDFARGLIALHNPGWSDVVIPLLEGFDTVDSRDLRVVAGDGVSVGAVEGTLALRAQAMAVLSFGTDEPTWPRMDEVTQERVRSPRRVWADTFLASTKVDARPPAVTIQEDERAAIVIQLVDELDRPRLVDDIGLLVESQASSSGHWREVVRDAFPSNWQVLLLDGPADSAQFEPSIRGDLLGAHAARVELYVIPRPSR